MFRLTKSSSGGGKGNSSSSRRGRKRRGRRKKLIAVVIAESNPKLVELPKLESTYKQVELRELVKDYAFVRVVLDKTTSDYRYFVIEPKLTVEETAVLKFVRDSLNKILVYEPKMTETEAVKRKYLTDVFNKLLDDYLVSITSVSRSKILYYVLRDYIGYGKIDVIMRDPDVEDISCDGANIPIYVYHRKYGPVRTNVIFSTDDELDAYVVALAQIAGKHISVANPILDATLPDGSRLNATFSRQITTRGSSFTIRKFKADPLTITDLVKFNTLSAEMAAHLWLAVQYGESMIFAGGTASGKTTTMNATSLFIPPASKIISIEDTREINLPHENWIAGVTRAGVGGTALLTGIGPMATELRKKVGEIDMYDLLRAALRQRPEYVIVGEVRGKETMTMFQAMATGHVTYSTMHADSVQGIVYRLENPPINVPRVLLQALNLVLIHAQVRLPDGKKVRRIREMTEIIGLEPTTNEIITNKVYYWEVAGDTFKYGGHSLLYEKIMDRENKTAEQVLAELQRRAEIIRWLVKNNIRSYNDVSRIIAEYYEYPERILKRVRGKGAVAS